MSENQKDLLRMQMELKRWKAQRRHVEDMIEEIHKRIDEFTAKVEAEQSLAV